MSEYDQGPSPSGWAIAGMTFASVMMILIGTFQAFAGLAAIIEDQFYVVGKEYAFDIDVTAWGWIHLLIGIAIVVAGFGLWGRKAWAAVVAVFLAMLSAFANFLYIPYYPFWAILLIALNVWVIWAITRPGAVRT